MAKIHHIITILLLLVCSQQAWGEWIDPLTGVTYTVIGGCESLESGSSCSAKESVSMCCDDDTGTKWAVSHKGSSSRRPTEENPDDVIIEASTPIILTGYSIFTGNDTQSYPGRNPKSWTIYGSNTNNGTDWVELTSVADGQMPATNYTEKAFTCSGITTAYKYFKFAVTNIVCTVTNTADNNQFMQISELHLTSATPFTGTTSELIDAKKVFYLAFTGSDGKTYQVRTDNIKKDDKVLAEAANYEAMRHRWYIEANGSGYTITNGATHTFTPLYLTAPATVAASNATISTTQKIWTMESTDSSDPTKVRLSFTSGSKTYYLVANNANQLGIQTDVAKATTFTLKQAVTAQSVVELEIGATYNIIPDNFPCLELGAEGNGSDKKVRAYPKARTSNLQQWRVLSGNQTEGYQIAVVANNTLLLRVTTTTTEETTIKTKATNDVTNDQCLFVTPDGKIFVKHKDNGTPYYLQMTIYDNYGSLYKSTTRSYGTNFRFLKTDVLEDETPQTLLQDNWYTFVIYTRAKALTANAKTASASVVGADTKQSDVQQWQVVSGNETDGYILTNMYGCSLGNGNPVHFTTLGCLYYEAGGTKYYYVLNNNTVTTSTEQREATPFMAIRNYTLQPITTLVETTDTQDGTVYNITYKSNGANYALASNNLSYTENIIRANKTPKAKRQHWRVTKNGNYYRISNSSSWGFTKYYITMPANLGVPVASTSPLDFSYASEDGNAPGYLYRSSNNIKYFLSEDDNGNLCVVTDIDKALKFSFEESQTPDNVQPLVVGQDYHILYHNDNTKSLATLSSGTTNALTLSEANEADDMQIWTVEYGNQKDGYLLKIKAMAGAYMYFGNDKEPIATLKLTTTIDYQCIYVDTSGRIFTVRRDNGTPTYLKWTGSTMTKDATVGNAAIFDLVPMDNKGLLLNRSIYIEYGGNSVISAPTSAVAGNRLVGAEKDASVDAQKWEVVSGNSSNGYVLKMSGNNLYMDVASQAYPSLNANNSGQEQQIVFGQDGRIWTTDGSGNKHYLVATSKGDTSITWTTDEAAATIFNVTYAINNTRRAVYLDPSVQYGGNDNNDGSKEHPVKTWKKAYSLLDPFGSVYNNYIVLMSEFSTDLNSDKGFSIMNYMYNDGQTTFDYTTWETNARATGMCVPATITSYLHDNDGNVVAGEIDYSANGSKSAKYKMILSKKFLGILADTRFEWMTFSGLGSDYNCLFAHYYNLEFGHGLKMTHFANGTNYGVLCNGSKSCSFQIFGGINNDARFKSDPRDFEEKLPHAKEGFKIIFRSGYFSNVCVTSRQTGSSVTGICGTPRVPIKCQIIIDIDREWNDTYKKCISESGTETAADKSSANYDIAMLLAGNHEGSQYGDVDLIMLSGNVARVVNGILGAQTKVSVPSSCGGGTYPLNSYMGRANILMDPSKTVDAYGNIIARTGSYSDEAVYVTELYGGGLGRRHSSDGLINVPVYGENNVTINGGTIGIVPAELAAKPGGLSTVLPAVFGGASGGVNGIGDDTSRNRDTNDLLNESLPYWYESQEDGRVGYCNYATWKTKNINQHVYVRCYDGVVDGADHYTDVDLQYAKTHVTINGGTFGTADNPLDGIYGGGSGYINSYIFNPETQVSYPFTDAGTLYGKPGEVASSVTINGGTFYCNIYGAGRGSYSYYTQKMSVGTSYNAKYAALAKVYGNVEVNVNGGEIHGNIYGGGAGYAEAKLYNTNNYNPLDNMALLTGNTIINIGENANITTFDYNGRTLGGNVYGGGMMAKVVGSTNVNISGNAQIEGNVFGAAQGIGGKTSTSVQTLEGTMNTYLLKNAGNNSLFGHVEEDANITVDDNAHVEGSVFGGGNNGLVKKNTSVKIIGSSKINGNVYGGGNNGEVNGTTKVQIGEECNDAPQP